MVSYDSLRVAVMRAQPKASHFIDGAYVEDTAGTPDRKHLSGHRRGHRPAACGNACDRRAGRRLGQGAPRRNGRGQPDAERGRILRRAADIMRERNRELSRDWKRSTPASRSRKPSSPIRPPAPTALEFFGGIAGGDQRRAYRARRRLRLYQARAARRLRRHRRLELSDPDRLLEGRACARLRQCHGLQAVGNDAALRR